MGLSTNIINTHQHSYFFLNGNQRKPSLVNALSPKEPTKTIGLIKWPSKGIYFQFLSIQPLRVHSYLKHETWPKYYYLNDWARSHYLSCSMGPDFSKHFFANQKVWKCDTIFTSLSIYGQKSLQFKCLLCKISLAWWNGLMFGDVADWQETTVRHYDRSAPQ